MITDSSGNLVERIKYYPFGEIREGGIEKYQFTGKEKDKLTDWYYYEARYYNPEFKHFTQADTTDTDLYDRQDLNRYAYVRNNPLKLVDPTGNIFEDWNYKFFGPFSKYTTPRSSNNKSSNSLSSRQSSLRKQSEYSNKSNNVFPEGLGVTKKGDELYGKPHIFTDKTQCTSYIAERYQITWGGDARNWLYNAKAQGYSIGVKPANKSIVVTNESDLGHVAIVEKIVPDEQGNPAQIYVSERNYDYKFQGTERVTYRYIPANSNVIKGYIYTEESTWY